MLFVRMLTIETRLPIDEVRRRLDDLVLDDRLYGHLSLRALFPAKSKPFRGVITNDEFDLRTDWYIDQYMNNKKSTPILIKGKLLRPDPERILLKIHPPVEMLAFLVPVALLFSTAIFLSFYSNLIIGSIGLGIVLLIWNRFRNDSQKAISIFLRELNAQKVTIN